MYLERFVWGPSQRQTIISKFDSKLFQNFKVFKLMHITMVIGLRADIRSLSEGAGLIDIDFVGVLSNNYESVGPDFNLSLYWNFEWQRKYHRTANFDIFAFEMFLWNVNNFYIGLILVRAPYCNCLSTPVNALRSVEDITTPLIQILLMNLYIPVLIALTAKVNHWSSIALFISENFWIFCDICVDICSFGTLRTGLGSFIRILKPKLYH